MGGKRIRTEWLRRLWRDGRTRILFWTGLVALLFGLLDIGQPIEHVLYVARTARTPVVGRPLRQRDTLPGHAPALQSRKGH